MHRNIARAYDCLQDEHHRIRAACVEILSENERGLQRQLLRANPPDPKHHDEMLLLRGDPVTTSGPTSAPVESLWEEYRACYGCASAPLSSCALFRRTSSLTPLGRVPPRATKGSSTAEFGGFEQFSTFLGFERHIFPRKR